MRKVTEPQLTIGQVPLSEIEFDIHSRDEIPQVLMGIQAIFSNQTAREAIFTLLKKELGAKINFNIGRPGMLLWNILVLGIIRLACNWDYDKLHEIANNHRTLRMVLGHPALDDTRYPLQTIKDNVGLFTKEIYDKISLIVINFGHRLKDLPENVLHSSVDSFVVETNVHFPTDLSLLWDAQRCAIRLIARLCDDQGLTDWRQAAYHQKKLKRAIRVASKLRKSTSEKPEIKEATAQKIIEAHQTVLEIAKEQVLKIRDTLFNLNSADVLVQLRIEAIRGYLKHSERQISQIRRRVIQGETIPHSEKVFSIFEPHTEWNSKGKAGTPVELGVKVCIVKDQYGFILHHHVMQGKTDDQIAVPIITETQKRFPNLRSASFDKGFHSPDNQKKLAELIELPVLPRKGKLSAANAAIESEAEFVALRRKHSAVESAINAIENHGLDRCPDHGIYGFERYVSLAVLARNLQIVGRIIQIQKIKALDSDSVDDKNIGTG